MVTPRPYRITTVFISVDSSPSSAPPAPASPGMPALLEACRALLEPLARLAIARGLHHADLDELLRAAFVDAALAAHPDVTPHRAVSRVSTATGLHRREVNRLLQREEVAAPKRSPATQVFTRWLSDPAWHANGEPVRALPRQGTGLSFETLAQSVTKDVHPRSLLEELCRLGLARLDTNGEQVELLRERFAPTGDEPRMLDFLARNVGDHLQAAVTNVLAPEPPHLEQALFADELSSDSVQRLQPMVREQWRQLMRGLAPQVQKLIDDDQAEGRAQDHRVRVGLYAFHEAMPTAAVAAVPAVPAAPAAKKSARRSTP
jgi:hypothetical protein